MGLESLLLTETQKKAQGVLSLTLIVDCFVLF